MSTIEAGLRGGGIAILLLIALFGWRDARHAPAVRYGVLFMLCGASYLVESAPLAVVSTRETMRRGLVDAIEAATERELVEQDWLRRTEDFSEGIKAMADRRLPNFQGR